MVRISKSRWTSFVLPGMAYFPDMNLNDAPERLRSVLRRQHKALATEDY